MNNRAELFLCQENTTKVKKMYKTDKKQKIAGLLIRRYYLPNQN
jgi:hypothetical protein